MYFTVVYVPDIKTVQGIIHTFKTLNLLKSNALINIITILSKIYSNINIRTTITLYKTLVRLTANSCFDQII